MHFNKTSPANTVDLSLSLESFFADEPNGLIGVGEGEKNSKYAKFFQYSYVYFVMKGSGMFVSETGQKIVVVPTFCHTLCQCRGAKKDFGEVQ